MKLVLSDYTIKKLHRMVEIELKGESVTNKARFTEMCKKTIFMISQKWSMNLLIGQKEWVNIHNKEVKLLCRFRSKKYTMFAPDIMKMFVDYKILAVKTNEYGFASYKASNLGKNTFSKAFKIITPDDITLQIEDISLEEQDHLEVSPKYRGQLENIYRTSIDERAIQFIENMYRNGEISAKKYYIISSSIISFNNKSIYFTVSSAGRLYTSFATLSNELMKFINPIDGEDLYEIDCANNQPLLLNTIIDHPQFKEACEKGTLYESLMPLVGTREETKNFMFKKILFGNSKIGKKNSIILDKVYPGLSEKINEHKFDFEDVKQKGYVLDYVSDEIRGELKNIIDKRYLWFKLQEKESSIFINCVTNTDIYSITRHDSIVCKESDIEYFKTELQKGFTEKGLKATLKVTKLN